MSVAEKKPRKRKAAPVFVSHKTDREPEAPDTGLPPRAHSFAMHLVSNGGVLPKAYVDAGYDYQGYEKTLALAEDLLRNPRVQDAVRRRKELNNRRYAPDAGRVLEELKLMAFSSIDDYEVAGGVVRVKPGVDPRAIRAIKNVRFVRTENHRTGDVDEKTVVELADKTKAVELSMRHHGLLQTDMPPLEVVLARLPAEISAKLRVILSVSDAEREAVGDAPPVVDEAFVELPDQVDEQVRGA